MMLLSCSAEQKVLEIPNEGEAVVAGYWSSEQGLCSEARLLKWKKGRVSSLEPLGEFECQLKWTWLWESYFLLPGWLDAHVHLALDSFDFYQCLKNWTYPSLIEESI